MNVEQELAVLKMRAMAMMASAEALLGEVRELHALIGTRERELQTAPRICLGRHTTIEGG